MNADGHSYSHSESEQLNIFSFTAFVLILLNTAWMLVEKRKILRAILTEYVTNKLDNMK